ncbi:MAG: DNA repair protein RadC [Clostridia bacterium]
MANEHAGHRERVREKVEKVGVDALSDIDMLEIALFNCMTRGDTRGIATALVKKFGSFSASVNAPVTELLKIKGLGGKSVDFLKTIPDLSRFYLDGINKSKKRIFDINSSYEYLKYKFLGLTKECVAVVILDGRSKVVFNDILWQGTVSQVPVYVRDLVALCIHYDADTVIIAHNHPSGNPAPSKGDLSATKELQIALESVSVSLGDHLIITDTDYTSMRKSGWLGDLITASDQYRKSILIAAKKVEDELDFDD